MNFKVGDKVHDLYDYENYVVEIVGSHYVELINIKSQFKYKTSNFYRLGHGHLDHENFDFVTEVKVKATPKPKKYQVEFRVDDISCLYITKDKFQTIQEFLTRLDKGCISIYLNARSKTQPEYTYTPDKQDTITSVKLLKD